MTLDPTHRTRDRVRTPVPEEVDVAVIGAGLGGLLAAARLARAGRTVAVFDSHYVAGGCATMFKRGPADARFVFDVGMHYVGDAGPGARIPAMLESVGAHVPFEPLDPDGFDRIHVHGTSFQVPWTIDAYEAALLDRFPAEARGIRRYIRILRAVDALATASSAGGGRVTPHLVWTALTRGLPALVRQRTPAGDIVDGLVGDPVLKAILFGIHGCYGVAPREVSAFMHFGLAAHYFRGGYYPRGGGQRIADALADAVERHGGSICLRQPVQEIAVEDGRAAGVLLADGRLVRARTVVSNACTKKTLTELVPSHALPAGVQDRADRWRMSVGIHLLSLGVTGRPADFGIRPGNEWFHESVDFDATYDRVAAGVKDAASLYITSASAKDPTTRGHAPDGHFTLQAMVFVSGDPSHWGVTASQVEDGSYRRDPAYQQHKQALDDLILDKLERLYPGIGEALVLAESATPLTQVRYTRASDGSPYGLAATPDQFMDRRPGPVAPLPGLFLAGASTRAAHGIIGSLNSGWIAADRVAAADGLTLAGPAHPFATRPIRHLAAG